MPAPSNTYPGAITVLSNETLPIGTDFSENIVVGQVPTNPTATLYDITIAEPGSVVTQAGAISLNGNVVTKAITGLTALHTYRLVLGLTATTGKVWAAAFIIQCPY